MSDESKNGIRRLPGVPQGLKPYRFFAIVGPAEAVPLLQNPYAGIRQTLPNA
jgi:hypothetical protein